MAQDDPKQMRSLPPALHQHPSTLAKIHLRFGTGFYFHPHKRHRLRLEQLPHEALHGMIAPGERMVAN